MADSEEDLTYPTVEDILTIHEVIVKSNEDTEPGVSARGDIVYVLESIQEGYFGQTPQTIHEKAYQLLRLLVANHPFVDGNKRTALASTVVFYALNGHDLTYGPEIKEILKQFGTDETAVDQTAVLAYIREHVEPLPEEYQATYQLWFELIDQEMPESAEESGRNDYGDSNINGE